MNLKQAAKTRKEYSSDLRKVIVRMHTTQNMSQSQIADMTGLPKGTIDYILRKFAATGTAETSKRSGRPAKLSPRDKRNLLMKSNADPTLPATKLIADVNAARPNKPVSVSTVQRAMGRGGLPGFKPSKKPFISKKNREARLKFAKDHEHWTETQWMHVLWTDESKFDMFSDGTQWIHRPVNKRNDPKYTIPTVKHGGGNVMAWGCFIGGQVGPLHRIPGKMDAKVYVDIMETKMLPWANANCPAGWKFQQDNDPKHTSNLAKKWFSVNKIKVIEWPSQSPDLNPIEHLWKVLKLAVQQKNPSNADEKFRILKEAWKNIPSTILTNLVKSMPRRCAAVIKAKGYATKY